MSDAIKIKKTIESFIVENSDTKKNIDYQRSFLKTRKKLKGIRRKPMRDLAKAIHNEFKEKPIEWIHEIINALWENTTSLDEEVILLLLFARWKRKFNDDSWKLIWSITTKIDDWSLCDTMGMDISCWMLKQDPLKWETLEEKISSECFWDRRLALITPRQIIREDEQFIDKTLLLAEKLMDDEEYYVQKAIVWMLREIAKLNLEKVESFLQKNESKLASFVKSDTKRMLRKRKEKRR
jgi:3-methyladenine DNA glycosylase AlkD